MFEKTIFVCNNTYQYNHKQWAGKRVKWDSIWKWDPDAMWCDYLLKCEKWFWLAVSQKEEGDRWKWSQNGVAFWMLWFSLEACFLGFWVKKKWKLEREDSIPCCVGSFLCVWKLSFLDGLWGKLECGVHQIFRSGLWSLQWWVVGLCCDSLSVRSQSKRCYLFVCKFLGIWDKN